MTIRRVTILGMALVAVVSGACGDDSTKVETGTTPGRPAGLPAEVVVAEVAGVSDSDAGSLRLRLTDATGTVLPDEVRVSVIGVDPPDAGQCLTSESGAFTDKELPVGATVYLVADAQDAAADGTPLRYVWNSDGELFNDKVLRQGFARLAPSAPNERYLKEQVEAEAEAKAAGRGVWACPADPEPTVAPSTPTTRRVPSTAPTPTSPTPTAPPTVPDTVPAIRTVPRGQAFSIVVGDSVGITGEAVTVTFNQVVSDSRCPSGVQCIQAGNATIAVTVAVGGNAATLSLNTDEGPTSGQHAGNTVELILLGRGSSSSARLIVT